MSENQIPFNVEMPSASVWSIHKTPEGKTYYYNKETKKSSWVPPAELDVSAKKTSNATSIDDPTLPAGWSAFRTPEGMH